MTTGDLSADAPATELFPQFGDQLYEMISSEVHGLTGEQLDFETDRWSGPSGVSGAISATWLPVICAGCG